MDRLLSADDAPIAPESPTYVEELEALMADVQHLKLGPREAVQMFLAMLDHAVLTALRECGDVQRGPR